MSQTFFPKVSKKVPASSPHPVDTEYKVSIGEEVWGNSRHVVLKVQMVYEGKIAGRRSPSFPIDIENIEIEDLNNVLAAVKNITKAYKHLTEINDPDIEFE